MAECNTRQRLTEIGHDAVQYFMEKLLFNIYDRFDEQDLTDVTFKLSNPNAMVTAHRLILSAASPYFRDLFRSEKGICPVIEITNIESEIFEQLITFCYTGKTSITNDNVERILRAALILQLEDTVADCGNFIIENISNYSMKWVYALERENQCATLNQKLFEYETQNFMSVVESEEFLDFDANKLQKILECNSLNAPAEKDVFGAVKRWYDYDTLGRKQQLPDLISCLRLTEFDTRFLLMELQPLPGCELIVMNALSWINCPELRSNITLKYTEKRRSLTVSTNELFFALYIGANEQDKIIFEYDKTKDSWKKGLALKRTALDARVICMNKSLILIGGVRDNAASSEVTSWGFLTKAFSKMTSMNEARHLHGVVVLNGKIYAIGGIGVKGQVLRSVEMYSGNGWQSGNGMIKPRYDAGTVVCNGKIYVVGGNDDNSKSVECYDPETDHWTRCADLIEPRYRLSITVHNGQIYVMGGRFRNSNGYECYASDVQRYDIQKNDWCKICSLSSARDGMGCVSFDNDLWLVGGRNSYGTSNSVVVYDEKHDKWIVKNPIHISGSYYCFAVPKRVSKRRIDSMELVELFKCNTGFKAVN